MANASTGPSGTGWSGTRGRTSRLAAPPDGWHGGPLGPGTRSTFTTGSPETSAWCVVHLHCAHPFVRRCRMPTRSGREGTLDASLCLHHDHWNTCRCRCSSANGVSHRVSHRVCHCLCAGTRGCQSQQSIAASSSPSGGCVVPQTGRRESPGRKRSAGSASSLRRSGKAWPRTAIP